MDSGGERLPFVGERTMKVSMEVELIPFGVPNFVLAVGKPGVRQDGFKEGLKFPVSEVPEETLIKMADQFKVDLLKKKYAPKEP
jgi:hypothetical protein